MQLTKVAEKNGTKVDKTDLTSEEMEACELDTGDSQAQNV